MLCVLYLYQLGVDDVTIYRRAAEDIPPLPYRALDFRPVRNLMPGQGHWQALCQADAVLWAVELDMQDDSSLTKLMKLSRLFLTRQSAGMSAVVGSCLPWAV